MKKFQIYKTALIISVVAMFLSIINMVIWGANYGINIILFSATVAMSRAYLVRYKAQKKKGEHDPK